MDRITQYKAVQNEAFNLFQKKNKDYGDSFANFGSIGVIVRMGDKINRLSNIEFDHKDVIDNSYCDNSYTFGFDFVFYYISFYPVLLFHECPDVV